jgi:hypothetical protein
VTTDVVTCDDGSDIGADVGGDDIGGFDNGGNDDGDTYDGSDGR